ncbi:MAG: phosphoketolase, partial [Okeania sp. SIO2H7]|nr:phosphoketolase [Okeania sp. SIO2H7]
GLRDGAVVLQEVAGDQTVVFAVVGDMPLIPVFEAAAYLETEGIGVRIVSVINPRRLYRSQDTGWDTCSEADGGFLDDAGFEKLFGGDALIGVTGGASLMLEPIMLRSQVKRDTFAWRRGETASSAGQVMAFNGITAETLKGRAIGLLN